MKKHFVKSKLFCNFMLQKQNIMTKTTNPAPAKAPLSTLFTEALGALALTAGLIGLAAFLVFTFLK